MSDKLISKEILDRALKALNALTKQKIDVEKERAEQVETLLNQAIIKVEAMLGGKSLRYLTQAEYDALTDEQKQDNSIIYNITDADFSHNHDDLYYNILEINTLLEGKSNVGHGHDDSYYTESEIDEKIVKINESIQDETDRASIIESNLQVSIDNAIAMLGGKSLVYLTQAEYDALTDEQKDDESIVYNITDASDEHNHDDSYYLKEEINVLLENMQVKEHEHDDLYYTETEIDEKIAEINESIQDETDRASIAENGLQVSINNTIEMLGGKSLRYVTQAEYDALPDEQKQDESIAYMVIDASDEHNHDDSYYSKDEIDVFLGDLQIKDHTHDDIYYTETEIDAKIVEINDSINESVQDETDRATIAENNLQVSINNTIEMFGGKSLRYVTQAEYDALTDEQRQDESIAYMVIDASDEHNHDDLYYSKDEIDVFLGDLQFKDHTHDDLYYTESEIDDKIDIINESIQNEADRATTAENGLQIDITNTVKMFDGRSLKYITQAEYDDLSYDEKMDNTITYIITDAENENDMNNYYTKEEVDITINEVNTEIDLVEAMFDGRSIKYMTQAEYDELTYEQKTDNTVAYMITDADLFEGANLNNYYTKDETDVAINEVSTEIDLVEAMLGGRSLRYMTQAEYDELTYEQKTDNTVAYMITDADLFESYSKSEVDNKFVNVDTSISTLTAELAKKLNISDHGTHLALGTSSSTAFRGDQGLIAYNHSQDAHAPSNAQKNSDITKTEIENKLTGEITSHKHDDSYYKKAETYTKTEIEEIKTNLETGITTGDANALSSAKAYADQKITALVNSAPEAMDTLNELATAINNHQTEYDAYVSTVSSNIATAKSDAIAEAAKKDTALHTTISAEIDADVKEEKDRAMGVENALQTAINGKSNTGHTHDDRYYTETEINGKIEDINETINTNVSTLTAEVDKKLNKSDHGAHLALGTTSSTAFRGDYGNTAYSHSQAAHAPVNAQKNSDITKAEIEAKLTGSIASHNHDGQYYTEAEINGKIEDINETINTKEAVLQASINSKANTNHGTHVPTPQTANNATFLRNDNTWTKVTPENIGAAPSGHNHDDRYYTESEMNTKLAGKSDTGHTHDDRYYTESEIDTKLNGVETSITTLTAEVAKKANENHGTHLTLGTSASNAYYGDKGKEAYDHSQAAHAPSNAQKNSDITKAEIEAKLTGSIASHNHTSVNRTMITTPIYNPNSGVLVDFNINAKSGAMVILKLYGNSYSANPPIEAIYQFYDYASGDIQQCTGSAISGPSITLKVYKADGKLKAWFQQPNSYCTFKLEVTYGNNNATPNVTLSNAAEPTTNITQTVTITPDRVYSAKYKPTPADIGAAPKDNTVSTVSVSGGKLTLTKAKRQKCTNITSGTEIVFPTVSSTEFLEIHLYFNAESNMNLVLPDCKWRVDPNIEAGKSYELVATWNTMNWLANIIVYS